MENILPLAFPHVSYTLSKVSSSSLIHAHTTDLGEVKSNFVAAFHIMFCLQKRSMNRSRGSFLFYFSCLNIKGNERVGLADKVILSIQ
jgi:hypothetical protein